MLQMRITDLTNDENFIEKVAEVLLDGFCDFGNQPLGRHRIGD